ncbi:MAG: CHASE2 domain-containing protein [Scytonematopsis contorta HA4267-MV1]|jgi:CHASE2 domain-containing sensor protein|nr:CHASE2 domain-containing protein [Scytonematopsis contorta HA4267-MV1]
MAKLVVLKLMQGSFEQGFKVILQIGEDGAVPTTEIDGYLPPIPEIDRCYNSWQVAHRSVSPPARLKAKAKQVKNVSIGNTAQILTSTLRSWLNDSNSFRPIREKMYEKLQTTERIRVILQTQDTKLWQLPWHLWDFFESYPLAELAVSTTVYEQIPSKSTPRKKVRILAVLGDSTDIDVVADQNLLKNLPDAETIFLVEPTLQELNNQLWDEKGWDILFFAGHSHTEEGTGLIDINSNETLEISQLKNALQKAISRGLKLAIFNSCDGLGLAQQLASLHIPQVIVMREPVPDKVAQEFLKHFLVAFSSGYPLYLAVREAREKLQGLENKFPYASWLPVIYQNLVQVPPTWQEMKSEVAYSIVRKHSLINAFFTSLIVTTIVMTLRSLGVLQPLEFKAFDQMLISRKETINERIAIIAIDDIDVGKQLDKQKQESSSMRSLSDDSLKTLLKILKKNGNTLVGLDLYRNTPINKIPEGLNLIGVCKVANPIDDVVGNPPPPGLPPDNIGFSDAPIDIDKVLRRQVLSMPLEPTSPCQSDFSFNFQLAFHYLYQQKGIEAVFDDNGLYLQLGKTLIKRLNEDSPGFYINSNLGGFQILVNYHNYDIKPIRIGDILDNPSIIKNIKNRIILIGATHQKSHDKWLTPYAPQVPGVQIQAQMINQLLSAALDNRPLLWFWPVWLDILWVGGWSALVAIAMWRWRTPRYQVITIASSTITLYVVGCSFLFLQGAVIPIVPTLIAVVTTGGIVMIFSGMLHKKYKFTPRGA